MTEHPTTLVSIGRLTGTQVRRSLSLELVEQYAAAMRAGDVFPPVTAFRCGNVLYLADGWHRKEAHVKCGHAEIDAAIHDGTEDDAVWFALGANRTHGQRLTGDDKAHAIRLAVQRWPERSSTTIAEHVGCNQNYVSELRRQVSATTNLPDRVIGKDGKSYPATRKTATVAEPPASVPAPGPPVAKVEYRVYADGQRQPAIDRSQASASARHEQIRAIAERGASIPQIAQEMGLAESTVRNIVSQQQIPVRAVAAMGRPRKHDPNRIVEQMVMDAENLTADVDLIEWDALDTTPLSQWLASLRESQRRLAAFVKTLSSQEGRINA